MTTAHQIADDLSRLGYAETEGKFFDYVTESLGSILAALRAVPDWQPIETAPKDGDDILVWGPGLCCLVVGWDDSGDLDFPWATLDGPKYFDKAFTHWMPLPRPPENEGTQR